MAPATSARIVVRSASSAARAPNPIDTPLPLISASPSFGRSSCGAISARVSASPPGIVRPSSRAWPRPITTMAIEAMCMRSDAPTEPTSGTIG